MPSTWPFQQAGSSPPPSPPLSHPVAGWCIVLLAIHVAHQPAARGLPPRCQRNEGAEAVWVLVLASPASDAGGGGYSSLKLVVEQRLKSSTDDVVSTGIPRIIDGYLACLI